MSKPTLQARAQFLGDVPNASSPIVELWMGGARSLLDEALAEIERLSSGLSEGTKWVDTDVRKPDNEQTVLAYWPPSPPAAPASYQSLTYYASDGPDTLDSWMDVFDNENDTPTHWMPLPGAPK